MRLLLILVLATGVLSPVLGQYLEGVIDIGTPQAEVLANPLSNKIYTSNYMANTVTIIDGATRQIIATRSVPSTPCVLCLNTVSNRVYCLCSYSTRLAIINGVTDSVKRLTIPHGGANAFAYNATLNRLYAGCDDGYVAVVDGAGDTVLYEVNLGTSWPIFNMFWNPATNHLFCSVGQDSVFVVDCQTDEVRARWYVQPKDRWCYSPVTGRVYTGNSRSLWVFSPQGDSILATISGSTAHFCAVPFPNKVYVYGWSSEHWLGVLDGNTNVFTDTLVLWGGPLICDTLRGKVYAASSGLYPGVAVLDARADTVLTTVPLPAFNPQGICWNPLDGRVYVTDRQGDSVYVLRDTMPGIEEGHKPQAASYKPVATVVGGVLVLAKGASASPSSSTSSLLDISGRRVLDLKAGANDVSGLAPGVYFVRPAQAQAQAQAQAVHKVMITR